MDILIDGVKIKTPNNPTGFRMSLYEISEGGRTADGTMTKDVIAKKHKIFFSYNSISGEDLRTILDLIYYSSNAFFTVRIDEDIGTQEYIMYVGELTRTFFRTGGLSGWYYKGFTFNLIEK